VQAGKIEVLRWDLPRLAASIQDGKLRIPDFQRAWVWERNKVVALLDSIYREFPVGSFFFWKAPTFYNKYFRDIAGLRLPPPRASEEVMFILDGQQRITSLFIVSQARQIVERHEKFPDGDPILLERLRTYVDICFDADDCKFRLRRGDETRFIPFCDLMDDDRYDLEDALTPEQRRHVRDCRMRFKNYPFSVIVVEDKTLDDVCDIFKRINQGGKRLSLSDLIIASTWSTDFNLRERIKADLNNYLDEAPFGPVEPEVVTETLALYLRGTATQAAQLELAVDEVEVVWSSCIQGIVAAIRFMYEALGVMRYEWLPYRAMLPVLAYFFAKRSAVPLTDVQRAGLVQWFWRSGITARYSQSAVTGMSRDIVDVMDALLREQSIILSVRGAAGANDLLKLRIERQSALKNSVYCLLALSAPRDFIDNKPIKLDAAALDPGSKQDRRLIFSRKGLALLKSGFEADMVMNAALLTPGLHMVMSGKLPSSYLPAFEEANPDLETALGSHLLPTGKDSPLWTDDYPGFLRTRADLIAGRLRRLAGLEETRPV
jgi:hypothetical protein